MNRLLSNKRIAAVLAVAGFCAIVASPASALDAYQDRTGMFFGFGLGGGTALQVDPEFKPGGSILVDGQLGGGASHYLTLALDLDIGVHVWDTNNNWFIIPGPQADFFVTKSVYIRAGVGLPIMFMNSDDVDETDATVGFDATVGAGFEFFTNASFAVTLAMEMDYVVLYQGNDTLSIGFSMGLRYY